MATASQAPASAGGPVQHTLSPSPFTPEQVEQLTAGIDPSRVRHTESGAAHLEQWDVRRRLNQVFGLGSWTADITRLQMVRERDYPADSSGPVRTYVSYLAAVRLTILRDGGSRITWYEDVATGDATSTASPGEAHGDAAKSAVSGALKRAAINLGDQFGLSLYNNGSVLPVVVPDAQAHIDAVLHGSWNDQQALRRSYAEAKGAGVLAAHGTIPADAPPGAGLVSGADVVIGPWIAKRGQELKQEQAPDIHADITGQQQPDGENASLRGEEQDGGDVQQGTFPPFEPIGYSSDDGAPDPEHEAVVKVQEMAHRSWGSLEGLHVTRQMAEQLGVLEVVVFGADLEDHRLDALLETRIHELERADGATSS